MVITTCKMPSARLHAVLFCLFFYVQEGLACTTVEGGTVKFRMGRAGTNALE